MTDQRRSRDGAADHDVDHPGREPRLEGQLGEPERPERRDLRGFGHDRVAGSQSGSRLLAHSHHRPVPRHDGGDHPVGLGQGVVEDAPGPRAYPPVQLVDPAPVVPDPAGGGPSGVEGRHGRAVVHRGQRGRVRPLGVEQVGQAVEEGGSAVRSEGPPGREGGAGDVHRVVDLGRPGQAQVGHCPAGAGVAVGVERPGGGGASLGADEVTPGGQVPGQCEGVLPVDGHSSVEVSPPRPRRSPPRGARPRPRRRPPRPARPRRCPRGGCHRPAGPRRPAGCGRRRGA